MDTFFETFRSMGSGRLVAMGIFAAGLLAFFLFVGSQLGTPNMALLYGGLDLEDSAEIVARLETQDVPYELRANGTQIFVPENDALRMRVGLAQDGLPAGGTIGYEIFDRGDALGTTAFVQDVNLVRALEGELARTIRAIDAVSAVRVHLVLPKRELFQRDTREPSASVVLGVRGSTQLSANQVTAIQHLIAAAVPQLKPSRISIVDDKGSLLSRGIDEEGGVIAGASRMEEFRLAFERRLKSSIEAMLERSLGEGAVWAEVSADLDQQQVTVNEEIFDPDGQVVRSTQTIEEVATTRDGAGQGPISVTQNLPENEAVAVGGNVAETATQRTEETTNFEITKRMTSTITEAGGLDRLSVAVLVDGRYDEENTYSPRSEAELEQIAMLVRSAVGFDAERGDQVEVINMRFDRMPAPEIVEVEAFLGLGKDDYFRVGELLIFAIVALMVVLLVLKPLVTRALSIAQAQAAAAEQAAEAQLIAQHRQALVAPESVVEESEMEQMIDMAQFEGRVRASSVKRIGDLVDQHPEEAVAILRNWLYQG